MTKKNPSTIQEIREELVRLETLWKTAEKWQGEEAKRTMENHDKLIILNGILPTIKTHIEELRNALLDENKGIVVKVTALTERFASHCRNDWWKIAVQAITLIGALLLIIWRLK